VADGAEALFERARERHAARDFRESVRLLREALALAPDHVEALEMLGTTLVTRRRRYAEGLELLERTVQLRPDDPGLWYGIGWCREFAAHESRRRAGDPDIDPRALYESAADAFRRCLELKPEGKLEGDAEDLLDHVENELREW
jgi:tetratricopeptide (TPR) repeat protein